MNNKIAKYKKEKTLEKLIRFFLRIFSPKKRVELSVVERMDQKEFDTKDKLKYDIKVDKELIRIHDLYTKFDNNEIFATNLSIDDLKNLIKVYDDKIKKIGEGKKI